MRIVIRTITGVQYGDDGDYVRDENGEYGEYDVENVYDLTVFPESERIEEAARVLREAGLDGYSSTEWQPHGWYCTEPYQDFRTGKWEEKTARLEGASEEDSRRLHEIITG